MEEKKTRYEEFRVSGSEILEKIKEIIREGNARRIIFKTEDGRTFMEIPLTVGIVGTLIAPVWAAIGAVAALASNLTIVVEKETRDKP
ncbi:MAG: hypothetical protein OP8BY_2014 [Candidatus Saccharicenans subterraneus]|uniref:DUF4342 domain-containing protein n=1 Tax=Candidatus Saccharicenans subterraneus TaxID=2508984 RepID=A0A3E2BMR8_9BACT|nr:MAG: hypothetical protein OP8BY_2014 [Candidatus Saccharicenans subterraneum]